MRTFWQVLRTLKDFLRVESVLESGLHQVWDRVSVWVVVGHLWLWWFRVRGYVSHRVHECPHKDTETRWSVCVCGKTFLYRPLCLLVVLSNMSMASSTCENKSKEWMSWDTLTHTHTHIITQHGVLLSLFSFGVRGVNRWRGWRGQRVGWQVMKEKRERKDQEGKGGKKKKFDGEMREGGCCVKIKYNLSRWKRSESFPFSRHWRKFIAIFCSFFPSRSFSHKLLSLSLFFSPFIPSPSLSFFLSPQSLLFPWRPCKEFQLEDPPLTLQTYFND